MKVAIVHNLPPGGARRILTEQVRHLRWEFVELCLGTAAPVTEGAVVEPFAPRAPAVARALRPPLRYTDFVRLLRAWGRVTRLVRICGADAVLAHPCRYLQAPPPLSRVDLPSVYFCHEPRRVDYEQAVARSRNPATRGLYWPLHRGERFVDRCAVRAATRIVTNSRYTAGRIQAAYGRDAIPLPLAVSAGFRPAPTPSPARHLLSVGALQRDKGHDLAIRAAALARRRRTVVIVAPRPDPGEAGRLRALALQAGIGLEVRVAISDSELCELYRQALATLYLAREEPFGLASLEAQACGCPVIVSAEGGLPETMVEGQTGWAVPRDPALAAARIDQLEEDPALRSAIAARAAARASALSWSAATRALEKTILATVAA